MGECRLSAWPAISFFELRETSSGLWSEHLKFTQGIVGNLRCLGLHGTDYQSQLQSYQLEVTAVAQASEEFPDAPGISALTLTKTLTSRPVYGAFQGLPQELLGCTAALQASRGMGVSY